MLRQREDKLWSLIKYDKEATPEQIKGWVKELLSLIYARDR
jgi:hypothetical protein